MTEQEYIAALERVEAFMDGAEIGDAELDDLLTRIEAHEEKEAAREDRLYVSESPKRSCAGVHDA